MTRSKVKTPPGARKAKLPSPINHQFFASEGRLTRNFYDFCRFLISTNACSTVTCGLSLSSGYRVSYHCHTQRNLILPRTKIDRLGHFPVTNATL